MQRMFRSMELRGRDNASFTSYVTDIQTYENIVQFNYVK